MVVVDSVTKQSHFVSTVTTLSAARTAQLYVRHIWKHHGLPKRVVSDWGPQFVAEFTRELYRLLGIKLAATTVYYPQGDRQTEWVNQELEQFLQLFTNQWQDDWDDLLPFTEFQYNNHVHTTTQNVPFLLDTSRITWMGFEPNQHQSHLETVNKFKEWMKDTLDEAKAALIKSKDEMAKYYDQKRVLAPDFQPGDKVYLDASDIQTTQPSKKLSHRRLGPFPMVKKVGNGTYWLRLPTLMSRLHPIFNVVKLTLAPMDPHPRSSPDPAPTSWNHRQRRRMGCRRNRMINRKLKYLIKWEGYGIEHNSWETWDHSHTQPYSRFPYSRFPLQTSWSSPTYPIHDL